MKRQAVRSALILTSMFSLLSGYDACSQDSRQVVEPVVPPLCTTLSAALSDPAEVTYGDDKDDTRRIQTAIDNCPAGHAVKLTTHNTWSAFVSGPLQLHGGVTLLIDTGTTLYASTDPRAYDNGHHSCGSNDTVGKGCNPFILVDHSHDDGIMGDGVIDGQGGQHMTGKNESWWQLSRRAQKENDQQNVPQFIQIDDSSNFQLYRITLRNSPKYHVVMHRVDGFTAWGVTLDTPATARNTDGIDPISSRNITVTQSFIRAGDDNISIKSNGAIPSEQISILHNHFYSGHGMAIGSNTDGGVRHVLVDDLTMDGTTSGLRIKSDISRGGLVTDIHYHDVCLREIRAPFDVDTAYTHGASGSKIPEFQNIFFDHIHSLTSGKMIFQGLDSEHPMKIFMSDVVMDGYTDIDARHAHFTLGPGLVQPIPHGDDVHISGSSGTGTAINCDNRFVAFPAKLN